MQQTIAGRTGIQWTLTKQLEDLDYADDITLLSHRQQNAQEKLYCAAEEAKTGLQINIGKTEVMRVNHKKQDQCNYTKKTSRKSTSLFTWVV